MRIPAPEGVLPLFVEHLGNLQQQVSSAWAPLHLLFFRHAFAHHLVHCRCGSNSFFQGRQDASRSRLSCYSTPARDVPESGSVASKASVYSCRLWPARSLAVHPHAPPRQFAYAAVGMLREDSLAVDILLGDVRLIEETVKLIPACDAVALFERLALASFANTVVSVKA
jgi:hypothetical protein